MLTVEDIRYGSEFNFDGKHWRATGEYTYEWQDGRWSREFEITRNGHVCYIEIEDQEERLRILFSKRMRNLYFRKDVPGWEKKGAPQELRLNGVTYELKEEATAIWDDKRARAGEEEHLRVWDYYNSKGKILSVELWEEGEVEVYLAEEVQPGDFTNITKGKNLNSFSSQFGDEGSWKGCLPFLYFIFFIALINSLGNCGGNSGSYSNVTEYTGQQFSDITAKFSDFDEFSVILRDMDFKNQKHYHKYDFIGYRGQTIQLQESAWEEIRSDFFKRHANHLGLELLTKKGLTNNFSVAPPGFSLFVGNENLGNWEPDFGDDVWKYNSTNQFLEPILSDGFGPPQRKLYDAWLTNTGRDSVYGYYNTQYYLVSDRGAASNWARLPQSVREEALRSNSTRSRRVYRSGGRSGSGVRSRSGGFGK